MVFDFFSVGFLFPCSEYWKRILPVWMHDTKSGVALEATSTKLNSSDKDLFTEMMMMMTTLMLCYGPASNVFSELSRFTNCQCGIQSIWLGCRTVVPLVEKVIYILSQWRHRGYFK